MTTFEDTGLIRVRDRELDGTDRHHLARAASRGSLQRVCRGMYVPAQQWNTLSPSGRYRLFCLAASKAKRTRPVLSRWSAAVMHGIPVLGPWPAHLHTVIERAAGGRSKPGLVAHSGRVDSADVVEVDGVLVTSRARTIVDLAQTATFVSAVIAADHTLHRKRPDRLTKNDLFRAFEAARPFKAERRVQKILTFATHLADSPAESASRANLYLAGFAAPQLQAEFTDHDGFIGATDFFWEATGQIGEVDGREKYIKPEYLRGRTPGQVVYEEKLREDRLRALNKKVLRWNWSRAIDRERLSRFLSAAGVPRR